MKKKFPYYAYLKAFNKIEYFAVMGEYDNLKVQIYSDNTVLITTTDKVPFDCVECAQHEFIHAYEKSQLKITDKFVESCPIAATPVPLELSEYEHSDSI